MKHLDSPAKKVAVHSCDRRHDPVRRQGKNTSTRLKEDLNVAWACIWGSRLNGQSERLENTTPPRGELAPKDSGASMKRGKRRTENWISSARNSEHGQAAV